ncbi:uncharacterized protein METZ01_LOCUS478068 [marine metagenome]|uniref:Uncharacterized protein n=1 Tax=marine metagenome TaxID=408172 RepID=A0A383BZ62_9ZZZZ
MKENYEIDTIVNKIAWLGVPALVLLITMAISPWFGGAAFMWALAALGGPFGVIVGVAVLIVISKYANRITDYGIEKVINLVVGRMNQNGKPKSEIIDEINNYKISSKLKKKIISYIENL